MVRISYNFTVQNYLEKTLYFINDNNVVKILESLENFKKEEERTNGC